MAKHRCWDELSERVDSFHGRSPIRRACVQGPDSEVQLRQLSKPCADLFRLITTTACHMRCAREPLLSQATSFDFERNGQWVRVHFCKTACQTVRPPEQVREL